jgi:hypothetical protein
MKPLQFVGVSDSHTPIALLSKLKTLKLAIPGCLLALICLLPYLNKAYTIDDPCFLLSARQILRHPTQPMSYELCWLGNETCAKSAATMGPGGVQVLMGYLLVPVILAGGAEWTAHLLQILLACIAVLEMVRLALRLGFDRVRASVAGLMLVAIPPFLPMASTAMPDIAALTLGLTGIERLLAWKDERRWHQAVVASLALGLAPYARPHLVLLLPLGALWLFDEFRIRTALQQFRREACVWAPLLVAACILVTVNLVTRDHGPKAESKTLLVGLDYIPLNLHSYLLYLCFPIPFAAVWLGALWRKAPMLLVLPAVPVLVLHLMLFRSKSLAEEWPLAAGLYGLATLAYMLYQNLKAWDRIGLLLSLWLLIPLPTIIYLNLPIKYFVGVLPAIVLILIRVLSSLPRPRELSAYGVLVFLCAAYSCIVLRADADFAECGRRAAAELIAPHVAAGEKVWYGGQWGFYWYAQEAGARVSKPGEPGPNPGELLAVGLLESGDVTRNRFPNRELVDSRHYGAPHGRTMGYHAGLYSNHFGRSLWIWAPETTNDYELWRIH